METLIKTESAYVAWIRSSDDEEWQRYTRYPALHVDAMRQYDQIKASGLQSRLTRVDTIEVVVLSG